MKQDPKRAGRTDISDLDADPVVVWQRRYYIPLVAITAWVFPSLVAALCWGDWLGGLVYAGVLRMFFVQQATFCVNSIAHYLGDQPFDDRHSPRDHFITALLTLGEGWHNFHHEFLSDWRNGIHWHQVGSSIILLSPDDFANLFCPVRSYQTGDLCFQGDGSCPRPQSISQQRD